jgi:hypothetical protein
MGIDDTGDTTRETNTWQLVYAWPAQAHHRELFGETAQQHRMPVLIASATVSHRG